MTISIEVDDMSTKEVLVFFYTDRLKSTRRCRHSLVMDISVTPSPLKRNVFTDIKPNTDKQAIEQS